MIAGLVEIAEPGRQLELTRGFLRVVDRTTEAKQELGRVPLDQVTALIISAADAVITRQLLVALAERKAVTIICDRNWLPLTLTLPLDGHHESAGILYDQIAASQPLQKRLWQQIVQAKIKNQAIILQRHQPSHASGWSKVDDLTRLSRRVKSGDPENLEAQAARLYWPALLGKSFRRRTANGPKQIDEEDMNGPLNYGYTVLRAATARAACASGLNTALGIHHRQRGNAFALIDDLMEPFRPLVDDVALSLKEEYQLTGMTPEVKRALAGLLRQDLITDQGLSPLFNCLTRLCQSLVRSFARKQALLEFPRLRQPDQLF